MSPSPAAICLVGLRGAGKTTVGRRLAALTGRAFFDLDRELERRAGRSIPELFAEQGEAGFRRLEAELIRGLPALLAGAARGAVVATGGGAVLDPQNRAALAATAAVYLRVSPSVSAARVAGDADAARPALAPGGPEAEARALLDLREPLYREVAAAEVDASQDVEAVAAAVLEALDLTPDGRGRGSGGPTRPPTP